MVTRPRPHHARGTHDGRDVPAPRDDRGMAGEAAGGGQDAHRAAMPWTSSGEVSERTRITVARHRPPYRRLGCRGDRPGDEARRRPAARGDDRARAPRARSPASAGRPGCRRPAARPLAREREAGSSAISTAIRSAACGLRLPTRHWSIQSRPCSIVNSMSQGRGSGARGARRSARSSRPTAGIRSSRTAIGSVAWVPATTSSPWALNRTSP